MERQTLELHPEAIAEARHAREWYAERSDDAGNAFMAELDMVMESICRSPDRWSAYLHGTRRYLMKRFPYFVVYRALELSNKLQVIAVAHERRKPGYWRPRLTTNS